MISVSGITKTYGTRLAVDSMTFDVAAGRVTGFVGPNGAGKSTTMRMMVGLARPDRGEVRYDGINYTDLRHPARVVGSVLDARCMHPGRTARNHLRALGALRAVSAERVDEVLADVGLEAIIARNETVVVVDTPQSDELRNLLTARHIRFDVIRGQLQVHEATLTEVSQLAFEHRILIVEITEASKSLEETVLEMTSSSAEFASASASASA